jgi:hypothetical protein
MPTRASKTPRLPDPSVFAFHVVQKVTGQPPPVAPPPDGKNPAAVALGKLGGSKGGKARAKALSKKQRAAIAKKAAAARWGKKS